MLDGKDKQSILSVGHRMKGTQYAVRGDFCLAVHQAKAKLNGYSKVKGILFKPRVHQLYIAGNVYMYQSFSDSVKQIVGSK